ncbi:hypothetical protein UFOVP29_19 [uncultured Caudovirales phage]|uniref:Uncharacterized protein n=1 Tax=uncultured Caudovirales phage TaxID=2100421 RepID=A0A6J5KJU6_9CAUD|nr:hypothetical protein UFOVP29_19 [uncultured Caudovirales phage]
MRINEIDYADSIPELNITDLDEALHVGEIDNKDVWLINDEYYYIIFFRDDLEKMMSYVAMTIAEYNGYSHLARVHNKSSVKGVITALLHFARQKGFKFIIHNTEPLTSEGFTWLEKLINSGGRGFTITDQTGRPPDVEKLKQEWLRAKTTGIPGPTSIMIESRPGIGIGQSILERYPSNILKPVIRFIGDTEID